MSSWRAALRLLVWVGAVLVHLAVASAATAQPAEEAPSVGDLEALVETLEDPEARAELIDQLRTLIAAQRETEGEAEAPEAGKLQRLSEAIAALREGISELSAAAGDPRRLGEWLTRQVREPDRRAFWAELLLRIGIVIAVGVVAGVVVSLALRPVRRRLIPPVRPPAWRRALLLVARFFLDLAPIAAFAVAVYVTLTLLALGESARLVALAIVNAAIVARIGIAAARAAFTPLAPTLRLIPVADETGAYVFVWLRRLINVAVYGYFLGQIGLAVGLPAAGYELYSRLLGLVVTGLVVALILQNRRAVAASIRKATAGSALVRVVGARLADVWHVLAIAYLVILYGIWAFRVEDGIAFVLRGTVVTVFAAIVAWLLVLAIRRGTERAFSVSKDIVARFPAMEQRTNRYLAIVRRGLETIVWFTALLVALEGWRIDALAWLGSPFGQVLIANAVEIVLILIVAVVIWEAVNAVIARLLEQKEDEGMAFAHSARVRTLLPLARKAVSVVVVTVSALTILSTLGVAIGPLLAGAGVIGLAVGFGAQTLVKDVITGAFILFEDAIAVGDVAGVGGHTGLVEAINIRTIRLRDLTGTVHVIPYSAVDTVTNLTKDFSYYLLDVGIAYRENVDEVIEVLRELLEEMREDPAYGTDILDALEVLGLDRFEDSAVIVRARIKTRPIRQWAIGREFNRRMKARFDELGIEIPFPHQTIYFGEDKAGQAPSARVRIEQGDRREDKADDARPAPARVDEDVLPAPSDDDEGDND